jgi:hypothetical protein
MVTRLAMVIAGYTKVKYKKVVVPEVGKNMLVEA